MAISYSGVLTANSTLIIPLYNTLGNRNIYTVSLAGTFGSGTVTSFTNAEGAAAAALGTTYDVAILDANGDAQSATANNAYDFECNSNMANPTVLKLVLAGATAPSIHVNVSNIS